MPHGDQQGAPADDPRPTTTFVARRPGRWHLTVAGPGDPRPVEVAAVLDLIPEGVDTPVSPPAEAVSPRTMVGPAWLTVGRVTPGGIEVEALDGGQVVLDAVDVRLLDAVDGAVEVDLVAHRTGLDVAHVAARLPGLVRAGAVRQVVAGAPPPVPVSHTVARPQAAERPAGIAPERPAAPQVGATGSRDRIPVYAPWHPETGPLLSLGMLTATARNHRGGALAEDFEIRAPEAAASFLADIATRTGPAVLLCSDYVWSIEANLAMAREARALCPDLVVVHGGPSCPIYEEDSARFLADHGDVAQLLVRGEGELVLARVLEAMAAASGRVPHDQLTEIPGLAWLDPATGQMVRTASPERISDLDALPSPYLTGEFDHIPHEAWIARASVETNRGCPYGCTFCDWGGATLSRIRKFGLDRVLAEIDWVASRQIQSLLIIDANFGILARDVEIAGAVAAAKLRTGYPDVFAMYPAKNTTRHLVKIMDVLIGAGVGMSGSLSLQTTDPDTLAAIDRSNISTRQYVDLAAQFRRRGHPMFGDLMIGLPGQTVDSFRQDLQFLFDLEIQERTWPTHVLPNAPMNERSYRDRWGIETDDDFVVVATSSLTRDDRARVLRLRKVGVIAERMGIFRHLLRVLQWDHGIEATRVMLALSDTTREQPDAYPLLTWLVEHFDAQPLAPVGWRSLYEEFGRFVATAFEVTRSSAWDCAVEVQVALMPRPGRTFPAVVHLEHDYLAYYRSAAASLFTTGQPGTPDAPLASHPPAELVVEADPFALCDLEPDFLGDGRDVVMQSDFYIGSDSCYELQSPLLRMLVHVANVGLAPPWLGPGDLPHAADDEPDEPGQATDAPDLTSVPVAIGRRA